MRKILLSTTITFCLFLLSCNDKSEHPKTAEVLKLELLLNEQANPAEYITTGDVTMKANDIQTQKPGLFQHSKYKSDGNIISGYIKNSAALAKFKDVVLTVTFLSQTGTVIEEKDFMLYEFYNANSTKPFSLKLYPPDATKQFSVAVKTASASN